MENSKIENYFSWLVFAIALVSYALTSQQTVMFWDSGEFIASSIKIQATHPPGAPLYTLMSRVFLLFFPTQSVAFGASLFSALCGAFTVKFLFHAIIWFVEKIQKSIPSIGFKQGIAAAIIGSLTLTFSDSFWVSSTEAEVYTLSTLFMAAAFWSVTKWDRGIGEKGNSRWIILIFMILGLSMGVHLLNLAVLFPVSMVIFMRNKNPSIKPILIALAVALGFFVLLNSVFVQGVLSYLISFELTAVNRWKLPQHSGAIIGISLYMIALSIGVYYSRKKAKKIVELLFTGLIAFTFGWSVYSVAIIRTAAETPTSNDASNVLRLKEYLQSSQFGFAERPLFYGQTFNSPRDGAKEFLDREPRYTFNPEKGRYEVSNDGKNKIPNYVDESKIFFSRMWNNEPLNVEAYQNWVDFEGRPLSMDVIVNGVVKKPRIPTTGENLGFFFNYQLGWLNFRYFMWNFAGRQNDIKGVGLPNTANWQSGIPFLDSGRVGSTEDTPQLYQDNPSKNEYYMLPLILGLIGLAFTIKYSKNEALIIGIFFLAFGAAITIFINQLPIHVQIRERDYIFLGAYYAFSIWVGIGLVGLLHWVSIKLSEQKKIMAFGLVCLILVPGLMAFKAWDDHDRSAINTAEIIAKNMLDQCESNAILFVSGDNITFPLWYMQEVLEYRTDVRVVDYNLLGLNWYTERLRTKIYDSDQIEFSLSTSFYNRMNMETVAFEKNQKIKENVPLNELLAFLPKAGKDLKIPTDLFQLKIDTNTSRWQSLNAGQFNSKKINNINWQLTKSAFSVRDFAVFDILQNNFKSRPIYFSNSGRAEFNMGLENYFLNRGMVNQLVPLKANQTTNLIDEQGLKFILENENNYQNFQDLNTFTPALDASFAISIFRNHFYDLALHLKELGKVAEAIEILNDAFVKIPVAKFPLKTSDFRIALLYQEMGDIEGFRETSRAIMQNEMDLLHWYTSFTPVHEIITYEAANSLGKNLASLMNQMASIDLELPKEFASKMQELDYQYLSWKGQNLVLSKRP